MLVNNCNTTSQPLGSTIAGVSCMVLVSLIAFCGNLLVFYIVGRNQQLYTFTNGFIINIAICHFLASVVTVIFCPASLLNGNWSVGESIDSENLCAVVGFLIVTLFNVAILTLTVISYIRYYSIKYPMRYPRLINKRRFIVTMSYVWTQSIIMALLPLCGVGRYEYNHAIGFCTIAGSHIYRIVDITITMILPFIAVFISATRILCLLYKNPKSHWRNKVSPMSENDTTYAVSTYHARRRSYHPHNSIDKQVTLLVVVFVNWVIWMPLIIVIIIDAYNPVNKLAQMAVYLLAYSSISINPMMYGALNRNFRDGFTELLSRGTQNCSGYSCVFHTNDDDSNVNWLCYRKRKISVYLHSTQEIPVRTLAIPQYP